MKNTTVCSTLLILNTTTSHMGNTSSISSTIPFTVPYTVSPMTPSITITSVPIDPPTSNVIVLGNPGAGKSAICNMLLHPSEHKDGVIFPSGYAADYISITKRSKTHGRITDTPGLASCAKDKTRDYNEVVKGLSKDGSYVLIFVITLTSGHVSSYDVFTIRVILFALRKIKDVKYGVVINQLGKRVYQNTLDSLDSYKNQITRYMPIKTDHFYLMKEADLVNSLLPQDAEFYRFIDSIQPTLLKSDLIQSIKPIDYEDIYSLFGEMDKVIQEREDIFVQLANNCISKVEADKKLEQNDKRMKETDRVTEFVLNGKEIIL